MRNDILLIALGYKFQAGKDTAANALVEQEGFTRISLGDEVKEEMLLKFRRTLKAIAVRTINNDGDYPSELRWLPSRNDDEAWWTRKLRYMLWELKPSIVRELLQEFATEVRRGDNPLHWVQALERRMFHEYTQNKQKRFVIADLRFLNEIDFVRSYHGICVRIDRPSLISKSTHRSEVELDNFVNWDYVILNDDSVEILQEKICKVFNEHILLS